MREIAIKYQGECKKCGNILEVGQPAMYEKSMGCFCIGCEPKDTEEIRKYRLQKAEAKATRYEEWAEKREAKAEAKLNSYPEIRHDWAFITQPGRIPFRERMNKSDERAFESLNVAERMREKAKSLRHVTVKGDAERKRQAYRDMITEHVKVGDKVAWLANELEIVKINKKTFVLKGKFGNITVDKALCSIVHKDTAGLPKFEDRGGRKNEN